MVVGMIERGDMVMVVRSCSCCPNDADLWLVFIVADITPEIEGECRGCEFVMRDRFVQHPARINESEMHAIPCSYLRKIEPTSETPADHLARLLRDSERRVELARALSAESVKG